MMKFRTLALLPVLLIATSQTFAQDGGDRVAARQQVLLTQAREATARKNDEAVASQDTKAVNLDRLPTQTRKPEQAKN
ncbi:MULTISPECIES: hypothetical protein [Pseudomonas]|uniref:Uncharacterized protein n=1 Tax=Pseudomonas kribbensis TaxID=1628086 RepID=A0A4Y8VHP0_9PSED|nr:MULTISPECIES: hypothetical protein [Pseudomonas]TFH79874.1 hypothetical protein E4J90_14455 [Pseudomonas kribbensis]